MSDFVPPWFAPYASGAVVALLGSTAIIFKYVHKITSGQSKAEIRNTNAFAERVEIEADNLVANRSAEFERVLNERASRMLDALETQIRHLSGLVESQSRQLTVQSHKMDHMEKEIVSLRKALNDRTNELHQAKLHPLAECNPDSCPNNSKETEEPTTEFPFTLDKS